MQFIAHDDVHHGERERCIATGLELHVPVGAFRRRCFDRIDDHDLRAGAVGFTDYGAPQVQIRGDGVCAPDQDETAVLEVFRQHRIHSADD